MEEGKNIAQAYGDSGQPKLTGLNNSPASAIEIFQKADFRHPL